MCSTRKLDLASSFVICSVYEELTWLPTMAFNLGAANPQWPLGARECKKEKLFYKIWNSEFAK